MPVIGLSKLSSRSPPAGRHGGLLVMSYLFYCSFSRPRHPSSLVCARRHGCSSAKRRAAFQVTSLADSESDPGPGTAPRPGPAGSASATVQAVTRPRSRSRLTRRLRRTAAGVTVMPGPAATGWHSESGWPSSAAAARHRDWCILVRTRRDSDAAGEKKEKSNLNTSKLVPHLES